MSDKNSDFLSDMVKDQPAETDIEVDDSADKAPEAEKGDPAPPETKPEATPAPEPQTEGSTVPLAALKAERDKRQARDRELEELKRQLAERQQPQQAPQPEYRPDFFESPENYVQQAVSEVQRQAQERLYAVLDAEAREAFPDYDEVMETVYQRVQENPALKQQIFSAPNPAKAAYRMGQQFKELSAMQDPVAYRERIRAELRQEMEAELNAKAAAKRQADSALPPDLASTRSNAGTSQPVSDVFETIFDK